jgi:mannose-6-phosphate isomerase-like protein (cupin superfamily)
MKYVSEAIDLSNMGLRRYRVEPGEQIPLSGLHYHDEQEEAFYVVSGTLTVETPDREYVVEADQFFVADPGSAHRASVASDATSEAIVIGMGAPPVSGDAHHYEA